MNNREFIDSWFDCKVNNQKVRRHSHGHLCADEDAIYSYGRHFPLATFCENGFLLNGDRYSVTTSAHQSLTRSACMETCKDGNLEFAVIPFTVLNNAGLIPVRNIEIVDKMEEQYRDVEYTDKNGDRRIRQEHLLGGSVIRYSARHFLSSNDPTSTWGNGYFLTELVQPVMTIEDALESLKPDLVRQIKNRLEDSETASDLILRQGEWFFVKVDQRTFIRSVKSCTGITTLEKIILRNGHLPSGDSAAPHHRATRLLCVANGMGDYIDVDKKQQAGYRMTPEIYCRGTIRHDTREHRMLKLGNGREWYLAVRNRQVRSWSYDGRVD